MNNVNNYPLVSVVMAAHNCERHIATAMDSILSQTFSDFEFIIIDDSSDDRTGEIVKSCIDKRIIYVVNDMKSGLSKSLNKGIGMARGKYIARMDADDFSHKGRLLVQAEFMERNPEVGVAGSWVRLVDSQGRAGRVVRYPRTPNFIRLLLAPLLNQPCLAHPSAIIRKDIFSKIGLYNEDYLYAQDYDLWLRIARRYPIKNIPAVLLNYRWDAASRATPKARQTIEKVREIIFSYIKLYLPGLDADSQASLLHLLIFDRQGGHRKGKAAFKILDNFLAAIRQQDGEKIRVPMREYLYLSNLAKLFYLLRLALDGKK